MPVDLFPLTVTLATSFYHHFSLLLSFISLISQMNPARENSASPLSTIPLQWSSSISPTSLSTQVSLSLSLLLLGLDFKKTHCVAGSLMVVRKGDYLCPSSTPNRLRNGLMVLFKVWIILQARAATHLVCWVDRSYRGHYSCSSP